MAGDERTPGDRQPSIPQALPSETAMDADSGSDSDGHALLGRELFRERAVRAKSERWLGRTHVITPPSARFWFIAVLACLAVAIGVLYFGEYTRRERVKGIVMPVNGLVRVRARSSGDVAAVNIREGASVVTGMQMLRIDSDRTASADDIVGKRVERELIEQNTTLDDEVSTLRNNMAMQQESISAQIGAAEVKLVELRSSERLLLRESESQRELLQRMESLYEQRLISLSDVVRQRSIQSGVENSLVQTRVQTAESSRQLEELRGRRRSIEVESKNLIRERERSMGRNRMDISRNAADQALLVRAPVDGRISSLLVSRGQSVTAGQNIATIIPDGAAIEVHLLAPSNAMGMIKRGDHVSLRYKAFPYEKYGAFRGSIVAIASSPIPSVELADVFGVQPADEPMYRVRVSIDRAAVAVGREEKPLLPGMAVDASIHLERRRLYQWLFAPAYAVKEDLSGAASAR